MKPVKTADFWKMAAVVVCTRWVQFNDTAIRLYIAVNMMYDIEQEVFCMRVQVNLNDDVVKRIDELAKVMGVSRSALCAVWIGNSLMAHEKTYQSIEGLTHKAFEGVQEETKKG